MKKKLIKKLDTLKRNIESGNFAKEACSAKEWDEAGVIISSQSNDNIKERLGPLFRVKIQGWIPFPTFRFLVCPQHIGLPTCSVRHIEGYEAGRYPEGLKRYLKRSVSTWSFVYEYELLETWGRTA